MVFSLVAIPSPDYPLNFFPEANEETRAFADSYNQCLRDDDEDFAFLEKQFGVDDIMAGHTDGWDENDNGENQESPDESVDVSEVHKTIKEKAREGVRVLSCCDTLRLKPAFPPQRLDESAIDPEDISWLEHDENIEDAPRVKNVDTRQLRKSRDISDLETVSYSGYC